MDKNLSNYFLSLGNVSLRPVVDRDVDRLVEIINDAYSYQDAVKGESRTNPDHLRKRISETDFYTVLKGDEIIGCIYLESEVLVLHFGLLTLAPDFRGKGIAEAIMNAIDKYADDHNFTTLDLDYMSLAPWLKKYYEKYGFAETGEVTSWGKIDLIRMQKFMNKEKAMKTKIIAAFPGTGKSYFVANVNKDCFAIDLDTNDYTKGYDKDGNVNNLEFPDNYLHAVKQVVGKVDYLFVGCQPEVLDILKNEDMSITLVYPERQLKEEYINRFNRRGSTQDFTNLLYANWDRFIDYLEAQENERFILKSGQYISDVITG